jgi:hypothetical protein
MPQHPAFAQTTGNATPEPASPVWFWVAGILFLVLLGFFLGYLVPYTNIVRDQGPNLGPSTRKTYSLSRCQMALWFFIVLGSYVFIYLQKGDAVLSNTALVLLGISFGTTAAAKVVDSSKAADAQAAQGAIASRLTPATAELQILRAIAAPTPEQQARLQAVQSEIVDLQRQLNQSQKSAIPQPSVSFISDILTDDGGASLHRFQMAVWTVVIAAIFVHNVWIYLAMPDFSSQLLGLMGISNGVYVGLKIPEK